MNETIDSILIAFSLITNKEDYLVEIVILSLRVSLFATFYASILGLGLAALLAVFKIPGKFLMVAVINGFLGLPPVVVGLFLYLMLSKNGPLNFLELLYTPGAMILAQTILITPVITALSYEILKSANEEYFDQLSTLGASKIIISGTILWESRYSLLTVVVAGFGRAVGEVGAVMIVGGNINHLTRVMTTAIALETSKGNLTFALALGIVLIFISLSINFLLVGLRLKASLVEGKKL